VRESETTADPVSDFAKPFPVFDFLDDFADEFEREAETPVEAGSSLHVEEVSEGPKKKRVKRPAGKTDLPSVRQLKSEPSKPSILKTTPKPSRKSSRLAPLSRPRFSKPSGGSQQEPVLVEDIVSSPDSPPVHEAEVPPEEQALPKPSEFDKGKAPVEPQPESPLPSPKTSPTTEPSKPSVKTPSFKPVSKRKISPKQVSK